MTDDDILFVAEEFRKGILDGRESVFMCYMICAPLQGMLHFHGVKTDLIESDLGIHNHYWLRLPDGRALDPSIDQFDNTMPPVYLGEETEWHRNATVK